MIRAQQGKRPTVTRVERGILVENRMKEENPEDVMAIIAFSSDSLDI
jgi:hypothetical protein